MIINTKDHDLQSRKKFNLINDFFGGYFSKEEADNSIIAGKKLSDITIGDSEAKDIALKIFGLNIFDENKKINEDLLPPTGLSEEDAIELIYKVYGFKVKRTKDDQGGNDYWSIVGYDNTREEKEVYIPRSIFKLPIAEIQKNSFVGCGNMEKIYIPETVKTVEAESFKDCINLKTISVTKDTIFERLKKTENFSECFMNCPNIKNICLNGTVESSSNNEDLKYLQPVENWYVFSCLPSEIKTDNTFKPQSTGTTQVWSEKKNIYLPDYMYDTDNKKWKKITEIYRDTLIRKFPKAEKIIIEEGIQTLGSSLFEGLKPLKEITLPKSLQTIGNSCFQDSGLRFETLEIPNNVISIGVSAFNNVPIDNLILGDNTQTIGDYAFLNSNLKSIDFKNAKTFGQGSFSLSEMFSDTIELNNIEEIYDNTFQEKSIQTLKLFNQESFPFKSSETRSVYVKKILWYTDTPTEEALNFVSIPVYTYYGIEVDNGSVGFNSNKLKEKIKDTTASEGTFVKNIFIPEEYDGQKIVGLRKYCLLNCTHIANFYPNHLINKIVKIPTGCFKNCGISSSNKLCFLEDFGKNLQVIETEAFFCDDEGLPSTYEFDKLVLPETIVSVGENAFTGCKIHELHTPASAKYELKAFLGTNPIEVDFYLTDKPALPISPNINLFYDGAEAIDMGSFVNDEPIDIDPPTEIPSPVVKSQYKEEVSKDNYSIFKHTTENKVIIKIHKNITEFNLSDIPVDAGARKPKIEAIIFDNNNNVTKTFKIPYDGSWSSLTIDNVVIPPSVTTFVNYQFGAAGNGAYKIENFIFNGLYHSFYHIESYAFSGVYNNAYSVGDDDTSIINDGLGSTDFRNKIVSRLERGYSWEDPTEKQPTQEDQSAEIHSYAENSSIYWQFKEDSKRLIIWSTENKSLSDVSLTEAYPWVKQYKNEIVNLDIRGGIVGLNNSMFNGYPKLEAVQISSSLQTIPKECFMNCSKLFSINLPNNITSIGESAFNNCDALTSITIPSSIKTLEKNAFNSCDNLSTIEISNSLEKIVEGGGINDSNITIKYYGTKEQWDKIAGSDTIKSSTVDTITDPLPLAKLHLPSNFGTLTDIFSSGISPNGWKNIKVWIYPSGGYVDTDFSSGITPDFQNLQEVLLSGVATHQASFNKIDFDTIILPYLDKYKNSSFGDITNLIILDKDYQLVGATELPESENQMLQNFANSIENIYLDFNHHNISPKTNFTWNGISIKNLK